MKNPPKRYIALGGSDGQAERPDQWIRPSQSVVIEVKAASVVPSDQFNTMKTLRFPRFKKLRMDKDWRSALSTVEFRELQERAETEHKENMTIDKKRKPITKRLKKELLIAGNDSKINTPYAGPKTEIFQGLLFCVITEMRTPQKKTKAEIEQIIKTNGGGIIVSPTAKIDTICLAEKSQIKTRALIESGNISIVRPSWVLDAIKQAEIDGPSRERLLIPFEPQHMFHMTPEAKQNIDLNVDMYWDSYARDVEVRELKRILDDVVLIKDSTFSPDKFLSEFEERGRGFGEMRCSMFRGCVAFFEPLAEKTHGSKAHVELTIALNRFKFARGIVASSEEDKTVTHVVVLNDDSASVKILRAAVYKAKKRLPRMVRWRWLQESWVEGTMLDEEAYALVA